MPKLALFCCLCLALCAARAESAPRLVVLPLDALECVRLLGGMEHVVGVSQHASARTALFPEAIRIPGVGRGFSPNLEAIAALRPDVVIAWEKYPGPELERQLEPLGIRILRLDLHLPHNVENGVRALANLLGPKARARGERYLRWSREAAARLRACLPPDGARPTVLAEHFTPERLAGPGSALFELTRRAGGDNLAAGLRLASTPVDPEWILEQNPAVLIKSVSLSSLDKAEGTRQLEKARRELEARPGREGLDAVRHGRVYALSSDILGGPRWVVGLAVMEGLLYPGLTPDAPNAEGLHEEYLRLFQGGAAGGALAFP